MKDYHINIFYSDEDGGYIADIPDLRYCSAYGDTPDEALAEVLEAKKAWLRAARSAKKRIPKPCFRPAIYQLVVWFINSAIIKSPCATDRVDPGC
jgi:predicted RNase H-like HicB family nuclease